MKYQMSKRWPYPARFLGKLPDGTRVHKYLVQWCCTNTTSRNFDYAEGMVEVTSDKPGEAIAHILDSVDWPCPVEAWTHGPKGGLIQRFRGWESIIGHQLLNRPRSIQETLSL